jgi:4-hydroxythreonine-4-phosphate dehydrogenase
MNMNTLPVVALTLGDPAGIGPELIARLLADPATCAQANVVVAGDPWLWEDGQRIAGVKIATAPVAGFADVRGRADTSRPAFLALDTIRPDQTHRSGGSAGGARRSAC